MLPKVYLSDITVNKSFKVNSYSDVGKIKISLISKAKPRLKQGHTIRVKVDYGQGFNNEMQCENLEDLRWAAEAFLDKFLWS